MLRKQKGDKAKIDHNQSNGYQNRELIIKINETHNFSSNNSSNIVPKNSVLELKDAKLNNASDSYVVNSHNEIIGEILHDSMLWLKLEKSTQKS